MCTLQYKCLYALLESRPKKTNSQISIIVYNYKMDAPQTWRPIREENLETRFSQLERCCRNSGGVHQAPVAHPVHKVIQ